MKIRLKTWHLLSLLLPSVLLPVCFIKALAQTPSVSSAHSCKGSHSRKDFYKNVRLLPPASVLEVVGKRLNYAVTEEGIELGSLELEDNYSIVPKDFPRISGCYGLLYCEKHLVTIRIEELPKNLCGVVKN